MNNFESFDYSELSKQIYRDYNNLRHNETERNISKNGLASFEDFVNFLVRTKSFDNHWKPFYIRCLPCSSPYDYIAKLETIKTDMDYLKHKLNLNEEHRKYFFPERKFTANFELTKKTFKKIPNKLAHRLYKVYQHDFEMFDYSFPDWIC